MLNDFRTVTIIHILKPPSPTLPLSFARYYCKNSAVFLLQKQNLTLQTSFTMLHNISMPKVFLHLVLPSISLLWKFKLICNDLTSILAVTHIYYMFKEWFPKPLTFTKIWLFQFEYFNLFHIFSFSCFCRHSIHWKTVDLHDI